MLGDQPLQHVDSHCSPIAEIWQIKSCPDLIYQTFMVGTLSSRVVRMPSCDCHF